MPSAAKPAAAPKGVRCSCWRNHSTSCGPHRLPVCGPFTLVPFLCGCVFLLHRRHESKQLCGSGFGTGRLDYGSSLFLVEIFPGKILCRSMGHYQPWTNSNTDRLAEVPLHGSPVVSAGFYCPALAFGLFFLIPLGWIIAALQNVSVLAFTQDCGRQPLRKLFVHSLRNAHYEWAQNHGILLILGFIGLFMWINVIGTCFILPTFAKSFLGIDSIFTINPGAAIGTRLFFPERFLSTGCSFHRL